MIYHREVSSAGYTVHIEVLETLKFSSNLGENVYVVITYKTPCRKYTGTECASINTSLVLVDYSMDKNKMIEVAVNTKLVAEIEYGEEDVKKHAPPFSDLQQGKK